MDAHGLSEAMLQAWKNHDWDAIRDVLHPDYVYTGPDGVRVPGIEAGLAAGWVSFGDAFPDGTYEIKGTCLDRDTLITEFHVSGTHAGAFDGIAPTGNKVDMDICTVMHLKDDKVVAERDYFDTAGFMAQLGVTSANRRNGPRPT